MTDDAEKIAPDFQLVAIDETHNWDEAITKYTGRIAGVYLINFAEVTHCCEITPSYWAEFVCNIFEQYFREPDGHSSGVPIWDNEAFADDPELEARSKAIEEAAGPYAQLQYENGGQGGAYYHCHTIDRLKKSEPVEGIDPDSDDPARDAMEGIQEHMANGEEWADLAPWAADHD